MKHFTNLGHQQLLLAGLEFPVSHSEHSVDWIHEGGTFPYSWLENDKTAVRSNYGYKTTKPTTLEQAIRSGWGLT